jgi:hypothetical protein
VNNTTALTKSRRTSTPDSAQAQYTVDRHVWVQVCHTLPKKVTYQLPACGLTGSGSVAGLLKPRLRNAAVSQEWFLRWNGVRIDGFSGPLIQLAALTAAQDRTDRPPAARQGGRA